MKTGCIYHNQDLDGFMSAAIVKHWWQKEQGSYIQENNHITNPNTGEDSIDFIGYNYNNPIPNLSNYDKVIMCDISFPKEQMNNLEFMLEYGNPESENFIWIDHHISAMNDNSERNFHGLRDVKFAACELTWKYFFPNDPIPEIVRLLGRYDCFGHKGTDEEQYILHVQYGARSLISNYKQAYEWLQYALKDEFLSTYEGSAVHQQIENRGLHIYDYLCTEAKQTYKNGFDIKFMIPHPEYIGEGQFKLLRFICINKERFNPINFGIDYHKDGYDGCACFWYANGMWNFSLYNDNEKVDCSIIAKQFGGGGHRGSSGFILNTEDFLKLINGR